jgi:phosphatidylserine/phosphatidylglycerophosphate/cardiolipin synthase-like enzyme
MTLTEVEAFLQRSIADRQFSGGEKAAFAQWLAANARTPQDRGVVRHAVFDAARAASASLDSAQLLEWLEDTLKVVAPVEPQQPAASTTPAEAFFSPGTACLQQITHRFAAARRSADVCVFTITDDRITRSILDAHRRGVQLRIITDNDKAFDLGSDVQQLRAAGVPLKVDATPFHMHHKFAIFDGVRLLNGSYNWTRGAAESNEENLIDTGDPKLIAAFAAEFQNLWKKL